MAAERAEKKEKEKQDAQRGEVEAARAELTAADEKKKGDSKTEEERRRRAPRGSRLVLLGFTGRM